MLHCKSRRKGSHLGTHRRKYLLSTRDALNLSKKLSWSINLLLLINWIKVHSVNINNSSRSTLHPLLLCWLHIFPLKLLLLLLLGLYISRHVHCLTINSGWFSPHGSSFSPVWRLLLLLLINRSFTAHHFLHKCFSALLVAAWLAPGLYLTLLRSLLLLVELLDQLLLR